MSELTSKYCFSSMNVTENQKQTVNNNKKSNDLVKTISHFEESVRRANLKTKNQNLVWLANLKTLAEVQIEMEQRDPNSSQPSQENVTAAEVKIYLTEEIQIMMSEHEKELIHAYVEEIRKLTTRSA